MDKEISIEKEKITKRKVKSLDSYDIDDIKRSKSSREFQIKTETGNLYSIEGRIKQKKGFIDPIYVILEYNVNALQDRAQNLNISTNQLMTNIANTLVNAGLTMYNQSRIIFFLSLNNNQVNTIIDGSNQVIQSIQTVVLQIPQICRDRNGQGVSSQYICDKILLLHASSALSQIGDLRTSW